MAVGGSLRSLKGEGRSFKIKDYDEDNKFEFEKYVQSKAIATEFSFYVICSLQLVVAALSLAWYFLPGEVGGKDMLRVARNETTKSAFVLPRPVESASVVVHCVNIVTLLLVLVLGSGFGVGELELGGEVVVITG